MGATKDGRITAAAAELVFQSGAFPGSSHLNAVQAMPDGGTLHVGVSHNDGRPEVAMTVADTGVDLISVGWITHSAPALDVALDFEA